MPSTRKPILGSWLMRTTALSAAVLITSIPLIVAERLGTPESQALAVALESPVPDAEAAGALTAQPKLDLLTADLHFVSVTEYTAGVEALVADLLASGQDSSSIATEIGRILGRNFAAGLIDYSDVDPRTLISNTAIIVAQLFEGALPSMPWPDLVSLGFDEAARPEPVRVASVGPAKTPDYGYFSFLGGANYVPPAPIVANAYAPTPVATGTRVARNYEPDLSIY